MNNYYVATMGKKKFIETVMVIVTKLPEIISHINKAKQKLYHPQCTEPTAGLIYSKYPHYAS
jgi:hypothetical protein